MAMAILSQGYIVRDDVATDSSLSML